MAEVLQPRPQTRAALEAVAKALTMARTGVGGPDVTAKDARDLVTATDVAVEDAIREALNAVTAYPVLGEERGGEPLEDASPYWLVDPICGTRNFVSRTALYSVNVALVEGDVVTIGIVGDASGEISWTERGRGAWSGSGPDQRRLTTSTESRTVIVELGRAGPSRRAWAASFISTLIREDRWDLRDFGTTLSLAYVAAGRFAAYVVFAVPGAMHAAAGSLLVREAGGIATDVDGRPWRTDADSIVASADAHLHEELLHLLKETRG